MNNSQDYFEVLLYKLEPDYSDAGGRYEMLRRKLQKFFAWRRCEDPASLADEVITRLVRKIAIGEEIRAANPYSFIYAIATNVFREYVREKRKSEELCQELRQASITVSELLRDCRMQCLSALPDSKRRLLEQYYSGDETREQLAHRTNTTLNALRLQVHRIKNELRACYETCLKQSAEGN
jgi:DNA-directed RNA polymerase specialized sigma24 family protein